MRSNYENGRTAATGGTGRDASAEDAGDRDPIGHGIHRLHAAGHLHKHTFDLVLRYMHRLGSHHRDFQLAAGAGTGSNSGESRRSTGSEKEPS